MEGMSSFDELVSHPFRWIGRRLALYLGVAAATAAVIILGAWVYSLTL